ncbi:hypothetical protein QWY85_11720 [Neolewinella lacunae]|uniref:Uncharacterized protein n=1 Tax=Neolewinella lacunae TaxID=1517758 RepID=A0A923PGS8_9BACT|nr:hypothetical protein [Neolewinella lacunae]MBC6993780.1 hypothetical protein [Neolewinella lacunae]MDN3635329.1 hypothetical protein [Neolewinella lacunae]
MFQKKISLWFYFLTVLILLAPYGVEVYRRIAFEIELKKIYKKCPDFYTGMRLIDFYEVTGNYVKPTVKIELSRSDSSYHHYIHYPPLMGKELYYKFEFDPFTNKLIQPGLPGSCPKL